VYISILSQERNIISMVVDFPTKMNRGRSFNVRARRPLLAFEHTRVVHFDDEQRYTNADSPRRKEKKKKEKTLPLSRSTFEIGHCGRVRKG